jgi:hypothetical protein
VIVAFWQVRASSAFAKSGYVKRYDAVNPSNVAQQSDCNRKADDRAGVTKIGCNDLQSPYGG